MTRKSLLTTVVVLFFAMVAAAQVTDNFVDKRDGEKYQTIKIGTQIWITRNLAFKTRSGSWAYNNNDSNVATYGYLYNWVTAKKACPEGWHLPSDAEWSVLEDYLGGALLAANKIKKTTPSHWKNAEATNATGFSALPGGLFFNNFNKLGSEGYWWSSSETESGMVWYRSLSDEFAYIDRNTFKFDGSNREGMSVRCLKN
jgi:uncharacterized protein (TIGR02145 family)